MKIKLFAYKTNGFALLPTIVLQDVGYKLFKIYNIMFVWLNFNIGINFTKRR